MRVQIVPRTTVWLYQHIAGAAGVDVSSSLLTLLPLNHLRLLPPLLEAAVCEVEATAAEEEEGDDTAIVVVVPVVGVVVLDTTDEETLLLLPPVVVLVETSGTTAFAIVKLNVDRSLA